MPFNIPKKHLITMKKNIIKSLLWAITVLGLSAFALPAKKTTVTFKVYGTCDMCQERIESAVDVKGVSYASYHIDSSELTVTYNPKKITEDQIHKLVAAIGHDTDKVKATDSAYQSLPTCCRYREGAKCEH